MKVIIFPRNMGIKEALQLDEYAHGYRHTVYVRGVPYVVHSGSLVRAAW